MVEEDETAGKTPEECRDLGLWEVDLVYYSLYGNNKGDSTKNKRGKAYKARSDSEYKCFEAHDGVLYRPGDHVFIEVSQCDPYYIGTISNFKMTKRDQLSVKVTRFYRPEDVPEDSYSLLLQDRQDDTSLNHTVMAAMQTRELFSSEISSIHPICHLSSGNAFLKSYKVQLNRLVYMHKELLFDKEEMDNESDTVEKESKGFA
uniref:Bm1941, isoform d n=1 Tax=Brugia malayi TaxID=6279 RepID=A0A1I9G2V9_BRUMA|nr:Bm1941, isoform d [Brugia malayi]